MTCFNVTWIDANGQRADDTIYADCYAEAYDRAEEMAEMENVDFELEG